MLKDKLLFQFTVYTPDKINLSFFNQIDKEVFWGGGGTKSEVDRCDNCRWVQVQLHLKMGGEGGIERFKSTLVHQKTYYENFLTKGSINKRAFLKRT